MGWLRLVGSLKSLVSSAKEPYERDDILQKRPVILRSLLMVATPYVTHSDISLKILKECNKKNVALSSEYVVSKKKKY